MPATYEPIASTTLTGNAMDITFSSIASTYTDLVLAVAVLDNGAGRTRLQFNSDTGSNYSRTNLTGTGSSAASYRGSNETQIDLSVAAGTSTTTPAVLTIHIHNYANTNVNKTVLATYAQAAGAVERTVGLWRSTNAITSVKFFTQGAMLSGTTAALYGIKAA